MEELEVNLGNGNKRGEKMRENLESANTKKGFLFGLI